MGHILCCRCMREDEERPLQLRMVEKMPVVPCLPDGRLRKQYCDPRGDKGSLEMRFVPSHRYKSIFFNDDILDDSSHLDFDPSGGEAGRLREHDGRQLYLQEVRETRDSEHLWQREQCAPPTPPLPAPLPAPSQSRKMRGLYPGLCAALSLLTTLGLVRWLLTRRWGVPLPSEPQIGLLDIGLSQALSYDVNPFVQGHVEHNCAEASSPDCLPAAKFNPTHLSTDQWVETAVAFGAKEICMTAHHESGFALWPTKHNMGYTVEGSPYKKDLLREFVNSCLDRGLRICYYWGPNANGWLYKKATPEEFLELQHKQLSELLADYGPVARLRWDHYSSDGRGGCSPGLHAPCPEGTFPSAWQSFVQQVRRESPRTMICPGPDCLGHVRQPRPGTSPYPVWLTCKQSSGASGVCETRDGVKGGDLFMPRETAVSPLVSGWFQSGPGDAGELAFNADDYWANFLDTVGMGLVSTVNAPPGTTGLVPAGMAKAMAELGRLKRPLYEPHEAAGGISSACRTAAVELQVHAAFNAVVSREDLRHGQRIAAYAVELLHPNGSWEAAAPPCRPGAGGVVGCIHGQSVGAMVVDLLGEREAPARLRWRCLESLQDPIHLRSFAVTRVKEPVLPDR